MSSSFFSRRGGAAAGTQKAVTGPRVGHLYLDIRKRLLYCLNETARDLAREGVPFLREDLERQPLQTPAGEPVAPDDLPLHRVWQQGAPCEAAFLLARPGAAPQQLSWSAAPLSDSKGLRGVVAAVTVAPPEPDWEELAGLAHDLRTPLQALRLLVPMLESAPLLHPEARAVLERIRTATDRAMSIGMDLLEWARGPTLGTHRVDRAWFSLTPFLNELAAEQLAPARRKGIELAVDLAAADGLEVHTDRVRLGRLLSNLLANAVRYTSAGRVLFSATWREDEAGRREALSLAVVDTGAGLSAEEQESIFQAYERGKAGREGDSGGSGVGLAVVDRLVKDLGLTLEVFSEYGRGSTFELLLPPSALRPAQSAPQPPGPQ
jgi:two-component sensor histidine kinase